MVQAVRVKQGELLRADPAVQWVVQDRVRSRGCFADLERDGRAADPVRPP
ncbi:hypothetical protein GCM10018965_005650 [Nonomuraea roseola]